MHLIKYQWDSLQKMNPNPYLAFKRKNYETHHLALRIYEAENTDTLYIHYSIPSKVSEYL